MNKYKIDGHNGIKYPEVKPKKEKIEDYEEITLTRTLNPITEQMEYKEIKINHKLLWEEEEEKLKNEIFETKRKVIL